MTRQLNKRHWGWEEKADWHSWGEADCHQDCHFVGIIIELNRQMTWRQWFFKQLYKTKPIVSFMCYATIPRLMTIGGVWFLRSEYHFSVAQCNLYLSEPCPRQFQQLLSNWLISWTPRWGLDQFVRDWMLCFLKTLRSSVGSIRIKLIKDQLLFPLSNMMVTWCSVAYKSDLIILTIVITKTIGQ